jgi:HlyD family secretion protein
VKSKVGGRVQCLTAAEGELVRAGQLLGAIEPTEIDSQVEQIRAQLAGARAHLAQARRGVRYQEEQTHAAIRQAEEAVRAAEARFSSAQEESRAQPQLAASAIAQAEAALKSAQDGLALLVNATHPEALVQARSNCDEARAAAQAARRNLDRQRQLAARGFASQQAVDAAQAELATAAARLEQARKRLDLVAEQHRLEIADAENRVAQARAALENARAGQAQVAIKRHEVLAAGAAVDQARAQLEAARSGTQQDRMREDDVAQAQAAVAQLEQQLREFQVRQQDTHLVAPMAGVVTRRYVEPGELVTSGVSTFSLGTPLLQIADLSRLLVRLAVNEVDVQQIQPGLPVEITVDGAAGQLFHGRVARVAPAALAGEAPRMGESGPAAAGATGSVVRFAAEVVTDQPDPSLKPGMSARCRIIIARRKGVVRVPTGCVTQDDAVAQVEVLTRLQRDGKTVVTFAPRPVVVGLRGDSHAEILSGLLPGDQVKAPLYTGPPRKGMEDMAGE